MYFLSSYHSVYCFYFTFCSKHSDCNETLLNISIPCYSVAYLLKDTCNLKLEQLIDIYNFAIFIHIINREEIKSFSHQYVTVSFCTSCYLYHKSVLK